MVPFMDATIDTVTNRAPTWWNDPWVLRIWSVPFSCVDFGFSLEKYWS